MSRTLITIDLQPSELSDDDLEHVAGGLTPEGLGKIATTVIKATVAFGTAVADGFALSGGPKFPGTSNCSHCL
ncbi:MULTISPECIES: hypothetical protein [unclassified Methylobacterium]|uniref:hypothetical protein n=1 Tax=unclassified Methylobacterium TaxID=2615210 RepID=UPI0012375AAB|nr:MULTISPECIES: hypothetical protein [Methylobacterium]WFT82072.1 hypothetical protein QA634_09550 [Methylobacterium nodulans]